MAKVTIGESKAVLSPSGEQIGITNEDLVLVTLNDLRITKLISEDVTVSNNAHQPVGNASPAAKKAHTAYREGSLVISIRSAKTGSRTTAIPWSLDAKGTPQFPRRASAILTKDRILFFGKHDELLELSVKLIESDEEEKEVLTGAVKVLSYVKTASSLVPGYGTAIGAGLGALSAILNAVKGAVRDFTELSFFGTMATGARKKDPQVTLASGRYTVARGSDVVVDFSVRSLDSIETEPERKRNVTITLTEIEIEPGPGFEDKAFIFSSSIGLYGKSATNRDFTYEVSLDDDSAPKVSGISNVLLYDGPVGFALGYGFAATFLREKPEKELADAKAAFEETIKFGDQLVASDGDKLIQYAGYAATGLSAVLSEVLKKKADSAAEAGIFIPSGAYPSLPKDHGDLLVRRLDDSGEWEDEKIILNTDGKGKVTALLKLQFY